MLMAIFSDMVEKTIEIFMDDFSVMGNSFDNCLANLRAVLARCEEDQLSTQLGKVPFHGTRGYCPWTSDLSKRDRGR